MSYGVKLSIPEQIEHMKRRGILFNIINEAEAKDYLENNNNYFKLRAYRKNYEKNRKGQYVGLEFAYLCDIAIIDMRLRYLLLKMCLDVEHNMRVKVIKTIVDCDTEDGYTVVSDFKKNHEKQYKDLIARASRSIYCADLQRTYKDSIPVWVIVEMMQFSDLCSFYRFVAKRMNDRHMEHEYYLAQEIRQLRNACAHSNCILNDLKSKKPTSHKPDKGMMNALGKIETISKDVRKRKMSNDRIRQIITLLFWYQSLVKSEGLKSHCAEELHVLTDKRFSKHQEYYTKSLPISSTFEFLKKVVDKWYPISI